MRLWWSLSLVALVFTAPAQAEQPCADSDELTEAVAAAAEEAAIGGTVADFNRFVAADLQGHQSFADAELAAYRVSSAPPLTSLYAVRLDDRCIDDEAWAALTVEERRSALEQATEATTFLRDFHIIMRGSTVPAIQRIELCIQSEWTGGSEPTYRRRSSTELVVTLWRPWRGEFEVADTNQLRRDWDSFEMWRQSLLADRGILANLFFDFPIFGPGGSLRDKWTYANPLGTPRSKIRNLFPELLPNLLTGLRTRSNALLTKLTDVEIAGPPMDRATRQRKTLDTVTTSVNPDYIRPGSDTPLAQEAAEIIPRLNEAGLQKLADLWATHVQDPQKQRNVAAALLQRALVPDESIDVWRFNLGFTVVTNRHTIGADVAAAGLAPQSAQDVEELHRYFQGTGLPTRAQKVIKDHKINIGFTVVDTIDDIRVGTLLTKMQDADQRYGVLQTAGLEAALEAIREQPEQYFTTTQ